MNNPFRNNNKQFVLIAQQSFCRLRNDEKYSTPEVKDLKRIREFFNLTQVDVAKITGVKWTKKGSTTVAKWEADIDKAEHRQIPYSAWRLLLITLGVVGVEEYTREK